MKSGCAFGFVHDDVVNGLRSYGNWKARQGAMDALLLTIEQTDFEDSDSRIEIPEFLEFLLSLMDDPNFKIKQGSIRTLHLFLRKIGQRVEYYLRNLLPKLAGKLSDPKDYVREGCIGVFKAISDSIGSVKLFLLLKNCLKSTTSRIRPEIVLLYITILLERAKEDALTDLAGEYLMSVAVDILKEALLDEEHHVQERAIEGLRLMHRQLGSVAFWEMVLGKHAPPDSVVAVLRNRCQQDDPLPYLDENGIAVIHKTDGASNVAPSVSASLALPLAAMKAPSTKAAKDLAESDKSRVCLPNQAMSQTGSLLEKRPELRSYPISARTSCDSESAESSEKERSTTISQLRHKDLGIRIAKPIAEEVVLQQESSEAAESSEKEKKAAGPRSADRPVHDHKSLFRRLFENANSVSLPLSTTGSLNLSTSSLDPRAEETTLSNPSVSATSKAASGSITSRLDRIAQLIRERDRAQDTDNDTAVPSKSASLASKKREHLDVLKMKQKDRRSHSASAVLQRSEQRPKCIAAKHLDHYTLPSIQSKSQERQRRSAGSRRKTMCCDGVEDDKTSPSRDRGWSRHIPTTSHLFSEDDNDVDVSGCISSPSSAVPTRPGTYASGISTAFKSAPGDITETQPFIDPDAVLQSAIDRLKRANNTRKKEIDWISQAEALGDARRLVYHHPVVVKKHKRDFVSAFVPSLQQLRSTMARSAIMLCQEVFEALGDSLEHEVDDIVPLLLKKAGETSNAGRNTFLASEADKALSVMIRNVSPLRSVTVLLNHAGNTSKYVRCKVAAHLDDALEGAAAKLSADANLSLIDRIFKIGVGFLEEGSLETRTHGKRMLWSLRGWINSRGAFQRLVGQLESETKRRRVRDVFEQADGPPPLPARRANVHARRMSNGGNTLTPLTPSLIPPRRVEDCEHTSIGGTSAIASSLVLTGVEIDSMQKETLLDETSYRDVQVCTIRRPPMPKTRRRNRNGPANDTSVGLSDSVSEILKNLAAKEWRVRIDALQQMKNITGKLRQLNERDILNIMDQLTHRLSDGNSKVVLAALETLKSVFEHMGRTAIPALNTVLPAIISNLASSFERTRFAAEAALDELIGSVDSISLVQMLSHCCAQANPRTKAFLLQKLESIACAVHSRKPQFVQKYILPVAFSSLSDVRLDVRQANADLLRYLAQLVGKPFIEKAEALTGSNRQRLFDIFQGSF